MVLPKTSLAAAVVPRTGKIIKTVKTKNKAVVMKINNRKSKIPNSGDYFLK